MRDPRIPATIGRVMVAVIIGRMLDINHRVVVEHQGGDIRYTSHTRDIRFHVRSLMDGSIDGEAPRNVVRLPATGW
jgi:hypothetical protein